MNISGFSFIGSAILSTTAISKNTPPAEPKLDAKAISLVEDSGQVQVKPKTNDFMA